MEEKKQLEDQIWFTRVSRIKAEKRLIEKDVFIQGINIYYSIVAIVCSIISFSYDDKKMGLFTIIITIGLLVSILFLNGQRYGDNARDYRSNYTNLHRLAMRLKEDSCDLSKIREEYCDLLGSSSNHTEYDYWCALANASEDYKTKKNWSKIRIWWWLAKGWRALVKFLVIVMPIVVLYFCEVYA